MMLWFVFIIILFIIIFLYILYLNTSLVDLIKKIEAVRRYVDDVVVCIYLFVIIVDFLII